MEEAHVLRHEGHERVSGGFLFDCFSLKGRTLTDQGAWVRSGAVRELSVFVILPVNNSKNTRYVRFEACALNLPYSFPCGNFFKLYLHTFSTPLIISCCINTFALLAHVQWG